MSAVLLGEVTSLLGVVLFGLGLAGVLLRRNRLSAALGSQLMGVGAVLALSAFAHHRADRAGQAAALIALTAVVAQGAVALSLVVLHHRRGGGAGPDGHLGEPEG